MMPRMIPRRSREPDPRGSFVMDVADMWDEVVGKPCGNLVFDEESRLRGERPVGRAFGNVSMGMEMETSVMGNLSGLPALARTPTLTLVHEGLVRGAEMWLFAIPDGDPDGTGYPVMVSDESAEGKVRTGRIDPIDGFDPDTNEFPVWSDDPKLTWKKADLPLSKHSESQRVSDHWHVFSKGRHWISYASFAQNSVGDDSGWLGIALLEANGVVATSACVISPDEDDNPMKVVDYCFTNDHFIVPKREGVFAFARSGDLSMFLIPIEADLTRGEDHPEIGIPWVNGSSGVFVPGIAHDSWHILVPETLDPSLESSIVRYTMGEDYAFECEGTIEEPRANLVMPTLVRLDQPVPFTEGWEIVTYRRRSVPTLGLEILGNAESEADIVRVIFYDGQPCRTETVCSHGAGWSFNRPHTQLYEANGHLYLLTACDMLHWMSNRHACHLRVERVDWDWGP